jgi:hypothetical protein
VKIFHFSSCSQAPNVAVKWSDTLCPHPDRSPDCSLHDLQLVSLSAGLIQCLHASRTQLLLLLPPLMTLPVVLSFLGYSCSLKSRSLMPLLHSGCALCLLQNVRHFRVPCTTWSLVLFSVVFFRPSVIYDRVSYVMPLLHGGSSLGRRRPTSSGILGPFLRLPKARCRSPCRFFSALL